MRKIRLFIASSLDGYIARTSGAVDWLFTDADYGYTEFYHQIDTVLMGNATYQQILSFGDYPYPDKKGFVFSQQPDINTDNNVEFINKNIPIFVNNILQNQGLDIWLVGGAKIIHYFLRNNWIDEIILSVHPLILGDGIPLMIKDKNLETELILKNAETYKSGLIQLFYDVKK